MSTIVSAIPALRRFLPLLLLGTFLAGCTDDDYVREKGIPVIYEFPVIYAENWRDSPYYLPDFNNGDNYVVTINSRDELEEYLPAEVIEGSEAYDAIDYATQTLISARKRVGEDVTLDFASVRSSDRNRLTGAKEDVVEVTLATIGPGDSYEEGMHMKYIVVNLLVPKIPAGTPIYMCYSWTQAK